MSSFHVSSASLRCAGIRSRDAGQLKPQWDVVATRFKLIFFSFRLML